MFVCVSVCVCVCVCVRVCARGKEGEEMSPFSIENCTLILVILIPLFLILFPCFGVKREEKQINMRVVFGSCFLVTKREL